MAIVSRMSAWGRWLIVGLGSLVALCAGASAAPGALLTILDGAAVLHVGARSVAAAEGLRLPDATIVETAASAKLLRIEWPDGSVLDLGPATQVMLQPGPLGRRDPAPPAFYLLRGWAKHRSAAGSPHRGHVSPHLDALPAQGVVVAHVSDELTWLFVESGSASLLERSGASERLSLTNGASYLRRGAAKAEIAARPDPELLKRVPRSFRDTIGLRATRFEGKEITDKGRPPDYETLRPWLTAEPALRRNFPRRFAPLARDRAFRAALVKQLPAHPEWERTLFPERFVKPASSPIGGSK